MRTLLTLLVVAALVPDPVFAASERSAKLPPAPFDDCVLRHKLTSVYEWAEVPENVRSELLKHIDVMADRGGQYNATDVMLPGRPRHRFIRELRHDAYTFVWYEHGGFGSHIHTVVYVEGVVGFPPKPAPPLLVANFQGDPCVATDAFLSGVSPAITNDY